VLETVRGAFEQALADFPFERLDLPAQRGLGEEDFLRRAADVAGLGHRHEVTQLAQFHARSITAGRRESKKCAQLLHAPSVRNTVNVGRFCEGLVVIHNDIPV
jgi:hypothetical protein